MLYGFIAAIVAFLVYHFVQWRFSVRRKDRMLKVLPTPPGSIPILGHALKLHGKKPWAQLCAWADKYGFTMRVNIAGIRVVYTNEPTLYRRILQTNQRNYVKDIPTSYKPFMCILGKGLVTAEGQPWVRSRTLMSHALRIDVLDFIPAIAVSAVDRLVAKLRKAPGPVEIAEEFRHLTLQVIGEAVLSLSPEECDRVFPSLYLPIVTECNKIVWSPWRQYLPLPATIKRYFCVHKLNRYVEKLIRERWALRQKEGANTTRKQDILDKCMSHVLETTLSTPTVHQLRDEMKTLILAGHETSAAMLTWAVIETTLNPKIANEIVSEYKKVFTGKTVPTQEKLGGLKWSVATLQETLRKHSVVPLVTRRAVEDDVFEPRDTGYEAAFTIPKGTVVMVGIEGTHSRADLWPEPQTFKPERFFDMEKVNPFAFLPFIVGPRNCLGQFLSLLENKIVLATLLANFRFEIVDPVRALQKHDYMIPVAPADGLVVKVHPRK